jgi:hypothetical protein
MKIGGEREADHYERYERRQRKLTGKASGVDFEQADEAWSYSGRSTRRA